MVLVDLGVQKVLEVLEVRSDPPGQQIRCLRRVQKVQQVRQVQRVLRVQVDPEVPDLLLVQTDQKDHLVHSDQLVLMVLMAPVVL